MVFSVGALGNLTSLEVLDLSYNKIWDLSETNVFNLPVNITELYLSGNNLAEIPIKETANVSHLKLLDVEFNKLTSLDQKLLNKIMMEGLQVNLGGIIMDFYRVINGYQFDPIKWVSFIDRK